MKQFSTALVTLTIALTFSSALAFTARGRFLAEETDCKSACPSISYFHKPGQADKGGLSKPEPNTAGDFCPKLKTTCCSETDFSAIKNWWQEDKNWSPENLTRVVARRQKLLSIAAATSAILGKLLPRILKKISPYTTSPTASPSCRTPALHILKLAPSTAATYTTQASKCWAFTSILQNTILCSVCDPQSKGTLDLSSGKITVGPALLKKFNRECGEFLF